MNFRQAVLADDRRHSSRSHTCASAGLRGANWSPVGSAQQYQGSVK
jgi:hypothetical protein